jgi:hypothetical protein
MPDFNVRSDSVNVELIMEQIRERIREKRGVDYTEQQIRDLAAVKLEKFLDPSGVRSDLLDRFRKAQPAYEPPELPNFAFEDATLFESHRGLIRWLRKLLLPFLKLLFNPNPLIQALNIQSRLNTMNAEREARRESARRAMDQLYYELIHNLVIETTRLGIDVKNLKMRLESVSSRLEFNERRARALEGVVVYKTPEPEERPVQRAPGQTQRPTPQPSQGYQSHAVPARGAPAQPPPPLPPQIAAVSAASQGQEPDASGQAPPAEGPGQRSRRRRRRRGRRGGGSAAAIMAAAGTTADTPTPTESTEQMDAMDRMDDDGSPESEEAHAAAAETVDQAASAEAGGSVPVVESDAAAATEATSAPSLGSAEAFSPPREHQGRPEPSLETASSEVAPAAGTEQAASPGSGLPEPDRGATGSGNAPSTLRPPENLEVAPSQVEGREPHGPPEEARGTTSSGQVPPSTSSGQAVPDPDAQ